MEISELELSELLYKYMQNLYKIIVSTGTLILKRQHEGYLGGLVS